MPSNMNINIRCQIWYKANALNIPPEEYDRKIGTQKNWRGSTQVVEHVV